MAAHPLGQWHLNLSHWVAVIQGPATLLQQTRGALRNVRCHAAPASGREGYRTDRDDRSDRPIDWQRRQRVQQYSPRCN